MSLTWASLNWLLDAASLWCFVAAFGKFVNPVELFAAYGIANVAGALPLTPGGLGVVDSLAPLLLVSFGVTRSVATLGVLGWRLVNFWLPIPARRRAYVSLKVPRGAGLKAMRAAVSTMMTHASHRPRPHRPRPHQPRPHRPHGAAMTASDVLCRLRRRHHRRAVSLPAQLVTGELGIGPEVIDGPEQDRHRDRARACAIRR